MGLSRERRASASGVRSVRSLQDGPELTHPQEQNGKLDVWRVQQGGQDPGDPAAFVAAKATIQDIWKTGSTVLGLPHCIERVGFQIRLTYLPARRQ